MLDVVVIGGGMVGATLAAALVQPQSHRHGPKVALVEAGGAPDYPQQAPVGDYDLRVSAISPASQRFLTAAGVWLRVAATRVSPFRFMRIWDARGAGELVIDAADMGAAVLGHIVENRLLQTAAWEVCETQGVSLYPGARVARIEPEDDRVSVILDDDRVLHARLVVGADGARSPSRRLMDIETEQIDYDQHCMVGNVTTERGHQATAWQRFRPQGPVAFLPLADGRVSIAWYESPQRCRELLDADPAEFTEALGRATDFVLGRITAVGRRASFPLAAMHARRYVRPRFALVGDAAHSVHPMAGQGVNLGMIDAATLAQVVLEACRAQRDPGAYMTLRRYERWRKGDNLLMLGVIDSLKRLYEAPQLPMRLFRNQGMSLVNALTPLKRLMMAQAMGERFDLPASMRPNG